MASRNAAVVASFQRVPARRTRSEPLNRDIWSPHIGCAMSTTSYFSSAIDLQIVLFHTRHWRPGGDYAGVAAERQSAQAPRRPSALLPLGAANVRQRSACEVLPRMLAPVRSPVKQSLCRYHVRQEQETALM